MTGDKDALANLCGITPAKFDQIFDYATLFTKEVPWHKKDAKMRGDMLLKETPHIMLVLVGQRVAEAFGVAVEPMFETFAMADGEGEAERVFACLKIVATTKDRYYKKELQRRQAKATMSAVVTMCQLPVSPEQARICCDIVRKALGDSMSFWTKKHVEDIEKKLDDGRLVDKHDLGGLMAAYASDVDKWVRPEEVK